MVNSLGYDVSGAKLVSGRGLGGVGGAKTGLLLDEQHTGAHRPLSDTRKPLEG